MSRRNKILIIILIVLVALALVYWLFLRPQYLPPETPEEKSPEIGTLPSEPLSLPPVNISPTAPEIEISNTEKTKSDISRLAAAFAERFGSYSNQGEFENILDLKPLMTEKMEKWADDFIIRNRIPGGETAVYSGVTTKSVSTTILNFNEGGGSAEIVVGTQRIETSGTMTGNQKVYYQNLNLIFKKIGDEWMVDGAIWE